MIRQSTHYECVDPNDPEPAGRCDRGGEMRKLKDLKREMEWRGNRLVWNGFLVCDHHRDVPNPQGRARHMRADPPPLRNPRPFFDTP